MRRSTLIWTAAGVGAAALLLRRRGLSFISPLDAPNNVVSSGWGDDRSYRDGWHEGLDFPTRDGTPVRAVADGFVRLAAWEPETVRGMWMWVDHAHGFASNYVHLSKMIVHAGVRVHRGQIIALSGHSGTRAGVPSGFGPHLHLTMRVAPSMLDEYERRFGKPSTGWGANAFGGVAVPAEPLIPARYHADVIADAARRGVAVRST